MNRHTTNHIISKNNNLFFNMKNNYNVEYENNIVWFYFQQRTPIKFMFCNMVYYIF